MSLFQSVKKYEPESKKSVEVKAKLVAHEATLKAARKAYDDGCDEVVRLTREYNDLFHGEGYSARSVAKSEELAAAKHKRDDPLHIYGVVKKDLERELER